MSGAYQNPSARHAQRQTSFSSARPAPVRAKLQPGAATAISKMYPQSARPSCTAPILCPRDDLRVASGRVVKIANPASVGSSSRRAVSCHAAMLSTILPRLCGAPASISWAMRASSSGSTAPTLVTSFPLSNNFVISFSRAPVTST